MKLSQKELLLVGALIVYVAFFTNPAPSMLTSLLATPVGHVVALLGVAYVLVYQSFVVGLFLGIAYVMTTRSVAEYLDETEQKPKDKAPEQPTASGIPPPAVTGAMKDLLTKGDTRLPQKQGKSETTKPMTTQPPKPTHPSQLKGKVEGFSSF